MLNQDILSLNNGLNQVGTLQGAKFSYAVLRNLNLIKPAVEKYEETRIALVKSFAKKDKKTNEPILEEVKDKDGKVINSQYKIENQEEFQKEFKKLLEEDTKIDLFLLEINEVPKEITAQQMAGIFNIIKE